jgi:hypothetical protein
VVVKRGSEATESKPLKPPLACVARRFVAFRLRSLALAPLNDLGGWTLPVVVERGSEATESKPLKPPSACVARRFVATVL